MFFIKFNIKIKILAVHKNNILLQKINYNEEIKILGL
jgi:hypothetical protein